MALLVGMTTSVPRVLNEVQQALQSLEGVFSPGVALGILMHFGPSRRSGPWVGCSNPVASCFESRAPILGLRVASGGVFNRFRGRSWIAGHETFPVGIAAEATVWRCGAWAAGWNSDDRGTIRGVGATLLALPESVVTVRDLPVTSVEMIIWGRHDSGMRHRWWCMAWNAGRTDGGQWPARCGGHRPGNLGELDREAVLAVAKAFDWPRCRHQLRFARSSGSLGPDLNTPSGRTGRRFRRRRSRPVSP